MKLFCSLKRSWVFKGIAALTPLVFALYVVKKKA